MIILFGSGALTAHGDGDLKEFNNIRQIEIYNFSIELFEAGEYYRAITEAMRYLSVFPQGRHIEDVYILIGDSYLMAEESGDAIKGYNRFLLKFPTSPHRNQIMYHKAICLIKKKDYLSADRVFQKIIHNKNPQKKTEALLWSILVLIKNNQFEEVDRLLENEIFKIKLKKKIDIIERTIEVKKNINYKSPELAGFMSTILPGSGQIYIERHRDGVFTFILNALFIGAAYTAFQNGNYALGGILTLFEIGWYTGNVYGAVSGAHKYNRKTEEDIFKKNMENFELMDYEVRKTPNISIRFKFQF
jgi:outer membrane protein assembly factor BamD (BamD/ComL family)/TM2 domain-containing membrane protein YozV